MKSYAARMKEAEKATIAAMTEDITTEFAAILAGHGFTSTSHAYDKDWEQITVTFKDPVRKDSVDITCDCDSHKFSAAYYVHGQDYAEDELYECSFKRFTIVELGAWLDGLGWTCETCEGEGTYWPTEEAYENDEEPAECPDCHGTGKTRKPVDAEKAA